MFIFQISKENLKLAKKEIDLLLNIETKVLTDGFLSSEKVFDVNLLCRLAYTKEVYSVLDIQKNLKEIDFQKNIKNSYKVECLGNYDISSKEICDSVFHSLKSPEVSLKSPKYEYILFYFNNKVYLLEKIYENKDSPSERKAHLRKFNHPTSLHPKQARAMINLVAKNEFIDPFCGAGGLLIEGVLMGLNVVGSDISSLMIKRATENLKELNLHPKLNVKDALSLDETYEAIVTDLPFGKNSEISLNTEELFTKFFDNAQKITSKIVVGHLSTLELEKLLKNTSWKIVESFEIYVHKSMTRKITIILSLQK